MDRLEMDYILVPQIVTTTTAMIWIGVKKQNVRIQNVSLLYIERDENYKEDENPLDNPNTVMVTLADSEWRTWKTRLGLDRVFIGEIPEELFHYQRVSIGNRTDADGNFAPLKPRTRYEIRLLIEENGKKYIPENSRAQVTTLPKALPKDTDKNPFKVMLGSCFYGPNDEKGGTVGKTFYNLPKNALPEISFLCGDQVYLDNPWRETTLDFVKPLLPPVRMRKFFFDKYIANWTQLGKDSDGDLCGFNLLLRNGANYFCSDDHEFWNNAPNRGFVALANTFFRGQRDWWFRESAALFRVFQSLAPWMTFDVPPVSFCIADSRINRQPRRKQFMEDEDLVAIERWIAGLKGPGVLVMGQLLLDEARWYHMFSDYVLPDYPEQYARLRDAIQNSKHSIVFLTGDVHFGRVSEVDLGNGNKFVEIVSSPMMVVTNAKGQARVGKVRQPPDVFKAPAKLLRWEAIAEGENHFVTLEFSETDDGKIKMKINPWAILKPGSIDDTVKKVGLQTKPIEIYL